MTSTSPQRIFITGGASGFGFALATHYAKQGWRVAIGDISDEQGHLAATELGKLNPKTEARYLHCNVTQESDLAKAMAVLKRDWDGLDVIVNNAGVAQVGAIDTVDMQDWQWITDINVFGVVRGCKHAVPLFKHQGSGYIVNIASMAGLLDVPNMAAYNATKAAVVSISETLQHELAPHNIGVSVVCPSFFRTNLGATMRSTVPGMDKTLDKLMSKSTLSADDIAQVVAKAIEKRQFYVIPHANARRIWRLKTWLPRRWYARMMQKQTAKLRGKSA
ncbi:SDR family oxidoreductase [Aliidiomarina halalkaliphila]|uniref:SDR family oxidoreductase n=1 Tax=Aliidiomarina halalkaliphila TaxID=2593535 RepID=A0A552X1K8_9GAMM|nr:SDR family oxidoreductase [Aliidiomarina halalkaliphila]TRW48865.1 SDR family oxidoreductase [Aliidiomarina halalkaliphila]